MPKNPRDYGTYDEWFQWLVDKKLAAKTWKSRPTQGLVHEFCRGYTLGWRGHSNVPISDYLSAKVDALAPEIRDRLRLHLIDDPDLMAKQNEPHVRALLDKLGVERGTTYEWKLAGKYTEQKLAELDEASRKQFLVAAGEYFDGAKFRTVAAFYRRFGKDPEPDVTRWRISAKGDALFEMWSILGVSGAVFRVGSLAPVARIVVRECFGGDAQLVRDLQATAPW